MYEVRVCVGKAYLTHRYIQNCRGSDHEQVLMHGHLERVYCRYKEIKSILILRNALQSQADTLQIYEKAEIVISIGSKVMSKILTAFDVFLCLSPCALGF